MCASAMMRSMPTARIPCLEKSAYAALMLGGGAPAYRRRPRPITARGDDADVRGVATVAQRLPDEPVDGTGLDAGEISDARAGLLQHRIDGLPEKGRTHADEGVGRY